MQHFVSLIDSTTNILTAIPTSQRTFFFLGGGGGLGSTYSYRSMDSNVFSLPLARGNIHFFLGGGGGVEGFFQTVVVIDYIVSSYIGAVHSQQVGYRYCVFHVFLISVSFPSQTYKLAVV